MTHSSLHDALPICRDKYWQILHDRDFVKGQVAYPYKPERVFVQDQGRDWRRQQDEALVHAGGWIIFGIGLLLALFLLTRGRIRIAEGFSGQPVQRFNAFQRANHWMPATRKTEDRREGKGGASQGRSRWWE